MSENIQEQTLGFQAEVSEILHLVTHALYSNKEIFIRELISNASDANDKLRFAALANDALYEGDKELAILIDFDKEAKTITISDNGIGMNKEEIIQHLGTIAKSGTKEFLRSLTGEQAKDSQLIGQFGVGFYSAFIVADKVTVKSRKAGEPSSQGVLWESTGQANYTVAQIDKPTHGTDVTLHLKADEGEFLDEWRIKQIIRKYSDHIPFPIKMQQEKDGIKSYETINQATALWTLPKSQIKESEYNEFYKHISHDFEDPLLYQHNKVEGKLEYTSLLYIPAHAPFDLFNREHPKGLKLYIKRVYITDETQDLLPMYLRFTKGVIDSNDLPLNVSREILQHNKIIDAIKRATVKRILDMLEHLAKNDPDKYQTFWDQFGLVMKEGPAEDFSNREKIAELLRFATTHTDESKQAVSLDEYVTRMKPEQEKIYYITAESFEAAKHSPHLEIFRKKGIEVLLLSDRIDEWLVSNLTEYKGKSFQSIAKGKLDLGKLETEEETKEHENIEKDMQDVVTLVKATLGERVKDVVLSFRLTDSPACVVADEHELGANIQRLLKASGQDVPDSKPILELNPHHPMVTQLKNKDNDEVARWSSLLLDQAVLAEGGQLKDPASFVKLVNELLMN